MAQINRAAGEFEPLSDKAGRCTNIVRFWFDAGR